MASYGFSFDGEPVAREVICPECGEKHDDVTIGCRYGYVDGQTDAAASLFTPTRSGDIFGRVLDQAEALKSDRIDDFWAITDWLVVNDSLLQRTVYHQPPKR